MKRLLILIALIAVATAAHADFKLWQLPPYEHPVQNMSYVIQTEHGKIMVVDGGYLRDAPMLRDFINERGGVVTSWFMTHYHDDHCGALVAMLDMPDCPKVEKVYMRPVSYEKTKMIENNGFILRFDAAMAKKKIPVVTPVPGTRLVVDGVTIEVLRVYNPEIKVNLGNNSSTVYRIGDSSRSVIFLGDLGVEGGKELLAMYGDKLKSDYCQMAHHGQNGVTKEVYAAIAPTVCMWPTPLWLWENNQGGGYNTGPWSTFETRGWMDELGVRTHYVAKDGILEIK